MIPGFFTFSLLDGMSLTAAAGAAAAAALEATAEAAATEIASGGVAGPDTACSKNEPVDRAPAAADIVNRLDCG